MMFLELIPCLGRFFFVHLHMLKQYAENEESKITQYQGKACHVG